MDSNKKRKQREKEFSEQRQNYYKNLRKEQKKKKKKRMKNEMKNKLRAEVEVGELKSRTTRGATNVLPPTTKEGPKRKRRLEDSEKHLPRGKRMVSASLQQEREKKQKKRERQILVPAVGPKASIDSPDLKELARENLTRKSGARSIGSGTFGNCYLGKYRGISVVIKEYKDLSNSRNNSHHDSLSRLQMEAKHEARVLRKLGDHPGIPLLFGVSLKEVPVSIVLKFHGDDEESLTVFKAAKNEKVSEQKEWNRILHDTANALEHIHGCGFAHNDLKANNVVLEKRQDKCLHPVIIDFGKSVAFSKAKNPVPKPSYLKDQYKNSYIAPELIDGTGKPSINSDVYSLAFMIKSFYGILKFKSIGIVKDGLSTVAAKRPSVSEVKAALRVAV